MKRQLSLAILLFLSACDRPATLQAERPSPTLTPFTTSSTLEVLPGSTLVPTVTDLLFHPLPTEVEALARIRRSWPNAVIVDIKRMSEPEAHKIAAAGCDTLLTHYGEVWVITMDGVFSKRYSVLERHIGGAVVRRFVRHRRQRDGDATAQAHTRNHSDRISWGACMIPVSLKRDFETTMLAAQTTLWRIRETTNSFVQNSLLCLATAETCHPTQHATRITFHVLRL